MYVARREQIASNEALEPHDRMHLVIKAEMDARREAEDAKAALIEQQYMAASAREELRHLRAQFESNDAE